MAIDDILRRASKPGIPELVRASDVPVRPKQWLWPNHLLRGALELETGIPNIGKSQVQIYLAGCVTACRDWPDGAPGMLEPANVIMLTAEDTIDQEVVPRLVAAGADLTRVFILKWIRKDDKNRQFLLAEDLEALEKKMIEIGDVALITIDPITAYMGGKMDSHKTTEVRSQLGPLKDFAERTNVAISAITHPPKSTSQRAIDQFIGSQAFVAAARLGHLCIEEVDPITSEKTKRVWYTHAKCNPGVRQPTLIYTIEGITVRVNLNSIPIEVLTSHVVWKGNTHITADEAVRAASGQDNKKQRGEQNEVQDFLRKALQSGEPMPSKPIIDEAKEQHGFTPRQLTTARRVLRVEAMQIAGTGPGWWWQLKISF
jgi:putative DNA primase/helicase